MASVIHTRSDGGQTRLSSLIESLINVAIGYAVAIASQLLIFPLFDVYLSFADNLLIGFYFTIISILRSYVLRRWFNKRLSTALYKGRTDNGS